MRVVYDIKETVKHLSAESVVKYKYGLSGKPYWEKVEDGELKSQLLKGTISRVFEDDLGHWPYIEVTDSDGKTTEWERAVNRHTKDSWYELHKIVEIEYCIEQYPDKYTGKPRERKCIIKIAIQE